MKQETTKDCSQSHQTFDLKGFVFFLHLVCCVVVLLVLECVLTDRHYVFLTVWQM